MAKLTRQEFADLCEMGTNQLSVSIDRDGKVVVANELIDTANPVNKQFIEKRKVNIARRLAKGGKPFAPKHKGLKSSEKPTASKKDIKAGKKPAVAATKKKTTPKAPKKTVNKIADKKQKKADPAGKEYGYSAELEKLKAENQELERQKRILDLEKKRGETIPVALFVGLLKQYAQSTNKSFQQVLERVVDRFSLKYKATPLDQTEMRKAIITEINKGIELRDNEVKGQIKKIVADYSETKERGERMM